MDPQKSHTTALHVTLQDLRAARYCLAGVRPWFRRHGFAWQEFLSHGIAAGRLRATGDALVEPVIRMAEMRQAAASAAASTLASSSASAPPATETRDGRG